MISRSCVRSPVVPGCGRGRLPSLGVRPQFHPERRPLVSVPPQGPALISFGAPGRYPFASFEIRQTMALAAFGIRSPAPSPPQKTCRYRRTGKTCFSSTWKLLGSKAPPTFVWVDVNRRRFPGLRNSAPIPSRRPGRRPPRSHLTVRPLCEIQPVANSRSGRPPHRGPLPIDVDEPVGRRRRRSRPPRAIPFGLECTAVGWASRIPAPCFVKNFDVGNPPRSRGSAIAIIVHSRESGVKFSRRRSPKDDATGSSIERLSARILLPD